MSIEKVPLNRRLQIELQTICQTTSRYLKYLDTRERRPNSKDSKIENSMLSCCPFCGADYSPCDRRVRLRSKIKANRKLKKWIEIYNTEPQKLGKFQLNMVQTYLNSHNKLLVTCNICKKTVKYPCQKRPEIKQTKTEEVNSFSVEDSSPKKKKKKKKGNKKSKTENNILSTEPLPEEKLPQVKNKQSTQVTCKKLEADSKVQYVKSHGEISVKGQGDTWKGQGHSKWQGGKRILPLNEQTSKSAKKKKSKQMNQQLSNLLAKEKSEKKSANLSDFLSNL